LPPSLLVAVPPLKLNRPLCPVIDVQLFRYFRDYQWPSFSAARNSSDKFLPYLLPLALGVPGLIFPHVCERYWNRGICLTPMRVLIPLGGGGWDPPLPLDVSWLRVPLSLSATSTTDSRFSVHRWCTSPHPPFWVSNE